MCAETTLPEVVSGIVALIVMALFELWFLCLSWDALRKGWIDALVPGGIYRRDNPIFFWLCFLYIVLMATLPPFCLFLCLSQTL